MQGGCQVAEMKNREKRKTAKNAKIEGIEKRENVEKGENAKKCGCRQSNIIM